MQENQPSSIQVFQFLSPVTLESNLHQHSVLPLPQLQALVVFSTLLTKINDWNKFIKLIDQNMSCWNSFLEIDNRGTPWIFTSLKHIWLLSCVLPEVLGPPNLHLRPQQNIGRLLYRPLDPVAMAPTANHEEEFV